MVPRNVVSISGQIRDPSFDCFKADLTSHDHDGYSSDLHFHSTLQVHPSAPIFTWFYGIQQYLCALWCCFFQRCNYNLPCFACVKSFCSFCSFIPRRNHWLTDGTYVPGSQKGIEFFSTATAWFTVLSRWSCKTFRRLVDTWWCFSMCYYTLWCLWYSSYLLKVESYLIIILRK